LGEVDHAAGDGRAEVGFTVCEKTQKVHAIVLRISAASDQSTSQTSIGSRLRIQFSRSGIQASG
jgi:hypothetical protein